MRPAGKRSSRTACLGALLLVAALPAGLRAQQLVCNATLGLDYSSPKPQLEPGDVVRVRLTLGSAATGGSVLRINRIRFDLDCSSPSVPGLGCADDGMVVAYEGDTSVTSDCGGVVFVSGHAPGDSPNQVVLTSIPPLEVPANTPSYCAVEFDVRVLGASNDATPLVIEQVYGFAPGDVQCDNGLTSALVQSGAIPLNGGGLVSCTGFAVLDHLSGGVPPRPGDTVRARITLGAGPVLGGTKLVINRLRFDLDCDRDAEPGLPCSDDGAVMEYGGDGTIVTTCSTGWASGHEASAFPNELVFRPFAPVEIPANTAASCDLEFDLRVLRYSNDSSPGSVEQTLGFSAATGDAMCDNGLSFERQRQTALELTLTNAFGPVTTLRPLPRNVTDFGFAVAAVGGDVLVGAPADDMGSGVAYLYDGTTGLLSVRKTFKNPDPASFVRFGESVAAIESDVLVGALAPRLGAGAAFRFRPATGELVQTFRLSDPDRAGSFGHAVAALGGNVLVGAPGADGVEGAVHLFDGATGALLRSFAVAGANPGFGAAVAALGGNVLIGAPAVTGGTGAAYLLDAVSGALLHTLAAADAAPPFGVAVAIVGSSAIVGSPGAVHVFDRASGDPIRVLTLPGTGPGFGTAVAAAGPDLLVGSPGDAPFGAFLYDLASSLPRRVFEVPAGAAGFGQAVAARGTDVIVGAPASRQGVGAAFVFDGDSSELLRALERPRAGPFFGHTVGVLGETLVVGAPFDRDGVGAVYLFRRTGEIERIVENPAPEVGDQFGGAIAVRGTTLLVGARGDDGAAVDAGAAYLFEIGPPGTPISAPLLLTAPSPAAGDAFGSSVAFVGGMLAVGAPAVDRRGEDAGAVHLFTPAGEPIAILQAPLPSPGAFFGAALTAAGANLLVGAPFDAQGTGAAYLIEPGTGLPVAVFANPIGGQGDLFGASVAALAGGRFVIGAPLDDGAGEDAGAAHLFDAGAALLRSYRGVAAGDQFGFSVAGRGLELLVGAPLHEPRGESVDTGAAYLLDTSGGLIWSFANPTQEPRDQFGFSIASAGTDVLIGAARGGLAHLFAFCASGCDAAQSAAPAAARVAEVSDEPLALQCRGGYCEDGDPCTVDLCAAEGCSFARLPDCRPVRCGVDLDCETPDPCDRAGRCGPCAGCFLHDWSCCSASSKCIGGPLPPDGTSCSGSSTCEASGSCEAGVCRCPEPNARVCPGCDDGDPCTLDGCDETLACGHEPLSGFAALTCLFEGHPLRIGQCEGEPVPPGIERRFDDARRLVLKALEAEKPRSARRLLRRAAHRLGKAARAVGKASRARRPSKRLGSHCAAGLSTILRAVQARAKEYAAGL